MTRVCEGDDIVIPPLGLGALLRLPPACKGLIVFAHGSGSSRFSVRNAGVAAALNQAGFATLLLDLLLAGEADDRGKVFDIRLLADRLIDAIEWADASHTLSELPLGLFGASTGAAAALVVAADLGDRIKAVVSRGGRPDLAGPALPKVHVPTLLIVGGNDDAVIALNQAALTRLAGPKDLRIISGATHLFPEPGAMDAVSGYAAEWFSTYLDPRPGRANHPQHWGGPDAVLRSR